jgi:hypothetical protein
VSPITPDLMPPEVSSRLESHLRAPDAMSADVIPLTKLDMRARDKVSLGDVPPAVDLRDSWNCVKHILSETISSASLC